MKLLKYLIIFIFFLISHKAYCGVFSFETEGIEPAKYSLTVEVSDGQLESRTSFFVIINHVTSTQNKVLIYAAIASGVVILLGLIAAALNLTKVLGAFVAIGGTTIGGVIIVVGVIAAIAALLYYAMA